MSIMQRVGAAAAQADTRARAGEFVMFARCLLAAGRDGLPGALAQAQANRAVERVVDVLKAAVSAGTTSDANWARPLVQYQAISAGFLESLANASAFQAMAGSFRQVPFRSRLGRIVTAPVAYRVSEGAPTPVSVLALSGDQLDAEIRVATIIALSAELARFSNPVATTLIGSELRNAVARETDVQFFSELLSSGVPSVPSSGASAADGWSDLQFLLGAVPLTAQSSPYFVGGPLAVRSLATRTTAGSSAFPDLGPMGGEVMGIPLLISDGIDEDQFVLLDASRIVVADSGIVLDSSEHATLALSDDGTGAQSSLWQQNMVGLKCERLFAMMPLNDNAVAYVSGVGGT